MRREIERDGMKCPCDEEREIHKPNKVYVRSKIESIALFLRTEEVKRLISITYPEKGKDFW